MVPCTVNAEFQTRIFDQFPEPLARCQMVFAERGTVHATLLCRAELGKRIEGCQHPVGIDAKRRDWIHHFSDLHFISLRQADKGGELNMEALVSFECVTY